MHKSLDKSNNQNNKSCLELRDLWDRYHLSAMNQSSQVWNNSIHISKPRETRDKCFQHETLHVVWQRGLVPTHIHYMGSNWHAKPCRSTTCLNYRYLLSSKQLYLEFTSDSRYKFEGFFVNASIILWRSQIYLGSYQATYLLLIQNTRASQIGLNWGSMTDIVL